MLKLESIEKVYKIDFCTSYGVEQEIEDTKEMILEECRQYLGQDYTDVIFASATNPLVSTDSPGVSSTSLSNDAISSLSSKLISSNS